MRKAIFTIALILAAIGAPVFAQVATTPYSAPWYFATSFPEIHPSIAIAWRNSRTY